MSKKIHETVNYRAGTVGQHCSICAMYISRQQSNGAPHCTAVVDPIKAQGHVRYFPEETEQGISGRKLARRLRN
jgi:hypothetical protein